jgi:electron transfer flavoprotein beta subunit
LVLTGAIASDDGYTAVGVILAEMLGVPHATMVKKIEVGEGAVRVNRELEGGLEEIVYVRLPAVLTIQTGINEPRYVSIMGIRRARKKPMDVLTLNELGLSKEEVGEAGSWVKVERMFVPPAEKEAIILSGRPDEIATQLADTLRARGVI